MAEYAIIRIEEIRLFGSNLEATISVETSWGATARGPVKADLSAGTTVAQGIVGLKNKVINWAAETGKLLTSTNIWIFGGPQ